MERIDVKNGVGGFVLIKPDKNGPFVYAAQALHYQRSFRLSALCNVLLVVACAVLAGYLSYHKHDPQPVKVSEEEYQQAVQLAERKEAEKAGLLRRIEDLSAIRRNLSAQLRTQNANNAKLIAQLEALHVSVPAQPIILKGLYKEASTDNGLRQAVARSFGGEIAGRIGVRP